MVSHPELNFPEVVNAFIEIIPSDTVKYELDKDSGYCKIDRLQKYSNILPALYGFVPKTYCGRHVAMTGGNSLDLLNYWETVTP